MSESIYTDPAAPDRGGVGISEPRVATAQDPGSGLVFKIIRRWWLTAICIVVAILASFLYLAAATKSYTATSVLAAEFTGGGDSPAGSVPADEFLFRQRDLIQSPLVLASAATAMIKSDGNLRDALSVTISRGEGVINIAYDAARPDDAARGANAVAEAYLRARASQQTGTMSGLTELTKQRDVIAADREAKEEAARRFRETASTAGSEAERAAAARLQQLEQAVTAAEVDATNAIAAAAAGKEVLADPLRLRAAIDANRSKGIFDRLEQQRNQVESDLAQQEPLLEKQRQAMLPQHPVVIATQRKIEQLKSRLAQLDTQYAGVYTAHLEQQRSTAQKRVEEMKQLVAAQSAQAKDYVARAAKLAEMDAELKKSDAAIAEVDRKIRDITLTAGASAAPTVRVIAHADAPSRPSRPNRDKTILTAAAIGLVAGLVLSAVLSGRGRGA